MRLCPWSFSHLSAVCLPRQEGVWWCFTPLSAKFKLTLSGMVESIPCFLMFPNLFWPSGLWQVFFLGFFCLFVCLLLLQYNVLSGFSWNYFRWWTSFQWVHFSLAKERLLIIKLETVPTGKKCKIRKHKVIFDIRLLLQVLLGLFVSLLWAAEAKGLAQPACLFLWGAVKGGCLCPVFLSIISMPLEYWWIFKIPSTAFFASLTGKMCSGFE